MKLNLQARLVAAVAQFKAHKGDIRQNITGVYAEPHQAGGVMLVATNGFAIGAWLDNSGHIDRPAILRTGKKLLCACESVEDGRIELKDNRLVVTDCIGEKKHIQAKKEWEIEEDFPNWIKSFPPAQDGPPSLLDSFNPDYFAAVDAALRIGSGRGVFSITTRQLASRKGILVVSAEFPEFAATIMPMLGVGQIPEWLGQVAGAKESAPLPAHEPSDAGPPNGDGRGWSFVTGGAA